MDVRLSPEQKALRDAAAQVVDRLGPQAVGQLDDRERAAKLDAAVIESGWRELRTPDETGAPWASVVEVALVAEELARGCADAAYLGPTLAAELRRVTGAPETTEPETVAMKPDLSGPAEVGDDAVAIDAAGAVAALVLQPAPGGFTLARAEITSTLTGEDAGVDLTRPTLPLATAGATAVDGQARVLTDDDLIRWTALGLAVTTADLIGVMQGAVTLTVDYAKERQQYGKAIGSFQALQHLMADMLVHLEGARSAGLHAAWGADALEPADALGYAASAKAYAQRGARVVCETSIQVHAGIGNTWECMAHVFLRRAQLATDLFGGLGVNLERVLAHAGMGAI
jgi:alkylation response protein AidB-like acyl-CoA dehydrogenase